MLKPVDPVKNLEDDTRKALYALFGLVPVIGLKDSEQEPSLSSSSNDLLVVGAGLARLQSVQCAS